MPGGRTREGRVLAFESAEKNVRIRLGKSIHTKSQTRNQIEHKSIVLICRHLGAPSRHSGTELRTLGDGALSLCACFPTIDIAAVGCTGPTCRCAERWTQQTCQRRGGRQRCRGAVVERRCEIEVEG